MLQDPSITVLGRNPSHRLTCLNGNSFQQDVLVSFNGWQYATWYSNQSPGAEPLYVHVGRRQLPSQHWEVIVFDDYPQHADDPHNTVQIGICHGDGTLHLSYDHHSDQLRYRRSVKGLCLVPGDYTWNKRQFTSTLDHLLGLPVDLRDLNYVTYPRFIALENDMLFSHRLGKAGLGSEVLWLYHADTGEFTSLGKPLTGVQNNPYINRIDYRNGHIHITWVYRGFIWYEGWDDPFDVKNKVHSGPNGPENNYDLCYAYSDDHGMTWKNQFGDTIASIEQGESIKPDATHITAIRIPKNSGLMNQEGQTVDHNGGVHALNRDVLHGKRRRAHHYMSPKGEWRSTYLPDFEGGLRGCDRGCMGINRKNDLYIVLPGGPEGSLLTILKATHEGKYLDYELVWQKNGFIGEPLIDIERLDKENVLSVFSIAITQGSKEQNAVVLDFDVK